MATMVMATAMMTANGWDDSDDKHHGNGMATSTRAIAMRAGLRQE
jgi:hypothetical protein